MSFGSNDTTLHANIAIFFPRVTQIYNEAAQGVMGSGKMYGLEGDIRLKARIRVELLLGCARLSCVVLDRSATTSRGDWQERALCDGSFQQRWHISGVFRTRDFHDSLRICCQVF